MCNLHRLPATAVAPAAKNWEENKMQGSSECVSMVYLCVCVSAFYPAAKRGAAGERSQTRL